MRFLWRPASKGERLRPTRVLAAGGTAAVDAAAGEYGGSNCGAYHSNIAVLQCRVPDRNRLSLGGQQRASSNVLPWQ